jgi:hypothetical protein
VVKSARRKLMRGIVADPPVPGSGQENCTS